MLIFSRVHTCFRVHFVVELKSHYLSLYFHHCGCEEISKHFLTSRHLQEFDVDAVLFEDLLQEERRHPLFPSPDRKIVEAEIGPDCFGAAQKSAKANDSYHSKLRRSNVQGTRRTNVKEIFPGK